MTTDDDKKTPLETLELQILHVLKYEYEHWRFYRGAGGAIAIENAF